MIVVLDVVRRLWKQAAFRGLVLSVGVLVAIAVHGHLRYRDGRQAGIAQERRAADSTAAIAKHLADSAWQELFAAQTALRDSLRVVEATLDQQRVTLARANARAASAEERYLAARRADTSSSPALTACDEMATACAQARADAEQFQRDAEAVMATQRSLLDTRDSIITLEPVRTRTAVEQGIRTWRVANPGPSRLTPFLAGVATGLLSLLIPR